MRFLIAKLKDGTFLTDHGCHTSDKQEALAFETEDKAMRHCRRQALLATHVPVGVPKEQLIKKRSAVAFH